MLDRLIVSNVLRHVLFSLALVGLPSALTTAKAQDLPIEPAVLDRAEQVDFAKEILPVLKRNCLACHHRNEAEGGLVLESYADLLKGGDAGPGIVPNDVDASYVFARASGREEPLMPPEDNGVGAETLTPQELALLQLWIQQGAPGGANADTESIQWQPLPTELQPVYALASSPDGRFVASGKANQVMIYEADTMRLVAQLEDPELSTDGHAVAGRDIVQSIAFSPDGKTIATGGFRTVRIWSRADGKLSTAETPFASAAGLVAANSDHSQIALVNAIGDIEIWNAGERTQSHVLQGHAETVRGLVWARDADRLFSIDDAGTLYVWQPSNGTRVAEAATNSTPADFAVSADGNHVAFADIQGKVQVWTVKASEEGGADAPALQLVQQSDAGANEALKTVLGITDATAVTFAPSPAPQLAVASEAGKVVVVDFVAGSVIRTIEHGAALRAIAIGGQPLRLVTAAADGTNRLWDFQSGAVVAELGDDPEILLHLASAKQDADRQAAMVKHRTDQKTQLENAAKSEAEALAKLKETRDTAAEAVKAEEKKVADAKTAAAETEAAVKQTEQAIAEATKELETAEQALAAAEASAAQATPQESAEGDGEAEKDPANVKATIEAAKQKVTELAATLKMQQTELETRTKAVTDAEAALATSQQELAKRQQAFDTAEKANQRATEAVPAQDRLIALEQRRSDALQKRVAEIEATLAASRRPFVAAAIAETPAQRVIMARADGTVRTFRGEDGTALDQFRVDSLTPKGLLVNDGEQLVVFGADGPAQRWSVKPRWELQQKLGSAEQTLISDRVTALDFHPDGHALAVGSGPPSRFGEVKIFATHSGQLLREWGEVHSDTVFGLRFSPEGRRLASAAADKTIRVLDIVSGKELRSLEGHTHHVLALAWQNDGQVIASASADQTVKVWDVERGEQKRTITGFPKEITALTFVGPTTQIATACADGNVRLHDVNNGNVIRALNASGDFLFTTAVADAGKNLVASGQSGVLRTWTVSDGKLLHETP